MRLLRPVPGVLQPVPKVVDGGKVNASFGVRGIKSKLSQCRQARDVHPAVKYILPNNGAQQTPGRLRRVPSASKIRYGVAACPAKNS